MKPGRCLAWQVGVKAPGTENNTTLRPLNSCSVVMFDGPSLVICLSVAAGTRSPTLIVIVSLPVSPWCRNPQFYRVRHRQGERLRVLALRLVVLLAARRGLGVGLRLRSWLHARRRRTRRLRGGLGRGRRGR